MSGHTQGKWIVHPKFPNYIVPESHADRRIGGASDPEVDLSRYAQIIVTASLKNRHRKESECAANARLIAAAPELLESLISLRNVCTLVLAGKDGAQHAYFETRSGSFVFAVDALRAVDAAIAKATGSQP